MSTRAQGYDPAGQFEVEERDVQYRADGQVSWLARIYRPVGSGPFPAMIDVHGGIWSAGIRQQDASMNRALAACGLLVAAIDFRLGPAHPYPASIQDVNYATRWLKLHAADFGATADRVGGIGASSGGHMVMLSALRPRDPRYAAIPLAGGGAELDGTLSYVIACWPVLDPHGRYLYARGAGRAELVERTEGYFGDEETMREASPTLILERDEDVDLSPTLVVAGDADANVPNEIVDRFVAAYTARGGEVELARFEGATHGFGNRPGPDTDRAIERMKQFVARQLTS
jgi:acetyl esterase